MEYRFTQVFFKEETAKPLVKLIIHSGIGDITKITGWLTGYQKARQGKGIREAMNVPGVV